MPKSAQGQKLSARARSTRRAAAIVGRPVNRAAIVDTELRRLSTRIESDFFAVCELVQEAIDGAYYARFGFADAERYLEDRLGLSYRSVRRRLAVLDAVRALPAKDQEDAKTQLAAVGSHKAAALAPALRQDPQGWREWVKTAAAETVEAVQGRVTRALGLKPRGSTETPGSRFLAYVLNQVGDARDEVEETFRLGGQLARSDHAVAVFISLCREVLPDWRARVQEGVE